MIKSVRRHVETLGRCRDNLSLLFNRMCPGIDEPDNKEHDLKDKVLTTLTQGYTADGYIRLYKHALKQWRQIVEREKDVVCFEMEVVSPLIVGKGDQNVHEFGITLQLPWGTPVIPGSSVKGVLSSFAHEQGGVDWQKSTLAQYSGELSLIMFGGVTEKQEEFAGGLDFYDAWWVPSSGNRPFVEDIINAHHKSYYSDGKSWPHGMESPNPVKFIVTKPGERFFFAVKGAENWRNLAKEMLILAAAQYGFGAKTRVGYGRMEYVKSDSDWISLLPSLDDHEITELYRSRGAGKRLKEAVVREVQRRKYSHEFKKILQAVVPAVCLLHDLKERPPHKWKDVKNVYDTYKNKLKEIGISREDPVVQEIFALVFPLAPAELPPWFAAFAPSAQDMLHGKSADEIDGLLYEARKQKWPPFADFEQAIRGTDLDQDEKELCLMTFAELKTEGK